MEDQRVIEANWNLITFHKLRLTGCGIGWNAVKSVPIPDTNMPSSHPSSPMNIPKHTVTHQPWKNSWLCSTNFNVIFPATYMAHHTCYIIRVHVILPWKLSAWQLRRCELWVVGAMRRGWWEEDREAECTLIHPCMYVYTCKQSHSHS